MIIAHRGDSIAPFVYARPDEYIRNDVGLNDLPVKLVWVCGGHGYGSNGSNAPRYRSVEDYEKLTASQYELLYTRLRKPNVEPCLIRMHGPSKHPGYLRLGRQEHDPGHRPIAISQLGVKKLLHGISHPMKK